MGNSCAARPIRVLASAVLVGVGLAASAFADWPTIQETPLPTASSGPLGISPGGLYATEFNANKIAVIGGSPVLDYTIPTAASGPYEITVGPDGFAWFTEFTANKIGRFENLPGGFFTEFPIPTASSFPFGIAVGPDGNLWFTEVAGNQIGRITTSGVITEFPIPTPASGPKGIAAGPDGKLWFVEAGANRIARIDTAGNVTDFPIPTSGDPEMIAAGPDGNLWFTEKTGGKIGRITTSGVVTEFTILTGGSSPGGIAAAPDGNMWFTERTANKLARITPRGVITEFPIPTASSGPTGIALGPDGALWFVENSANNFSRALVNVFDLPTPAHPNGVTTGPDGAVWFTDFDGDHVGRIGRDGTLTEFPVPTPGSLPISIVTGPDGNLWIGYVNKSAVGRVTPSGAITDFPVFGHSASLTVGPDGNLWFTSPNYNKVGKISTAGVTTSYTVPTASSTPRAIAPGPDGNLWFTESNGNKIGRITPAGVITEFSVPTAGVGPTGITAGPDGNLWFTEFAGSSVGKITTAGVITELPGPIGGAITLGPDGNLWVGGVVDVTRFTPSGVGMAFQASGTPGESDSMCVGPDGNIWFGRQYNHQIAYVTPTQQALGLTIDDNGNGIVEAGETFTVSPHWMNWAGTIQLNGAASAFAGPGSGTYSLLDGVASYATVAAATPVECSAASEDCYQLTLGNPGARPVQHWDATFVETLDSHETKTWKLHVGGSFADVPSSAGTYRFVENIFHNGITGGCTPGNYCPADPVTRQQIAVFLLLAEHKTGYVPPPCTTAQFGDVPCSSGFARWINQLVAESVTAGCGGGNYCPTTAVTRAQMSVFLLRSFEGSSYVPPSCILPTFSDVPCSSGFAAWIEELVRRGITAGCGGGNYCPATAVTRGQMAVFLTTTFGLTLYGP